MPFCMYGDCENYTEGNTDFCASHNHAMRKAKKDASKVKVVTPIRKVSEKQAKELQVYEVLRAEHLKDHPDCQIKLIGCKNDRKTNTVHHCAKRGANLNKKEFFKTACLWCHDYVEFVMSAKERREKGLLQ